MEEDKKMDVFEEDEHWKVSWLEVGNPSAVTVKGESSYYGNVLRFRIYL